jgi:hypothetical protein
MFVWSRTVGNDELILRKLTDVIENLIRGNQLCTREMTGIKRRFVSYIDNKDLVILHLLLKFNDRDSRSAVGITRGSRGSLVRILFDLRHLCPGATAEQNHRGEQENRCQIQMGAH